MKTPDKPSAKERVRWKAVNEPKRQKQEQAQNSFHGETDFEAAAPNPAKEQMRSNFVRQFRELKQNTAENASVSVTQEKSPGREKSPGIKNTPGSKSREYRAKPKEALYPNYRSAGQCQIMLPHDSSSGTVSKAKIVKEQGRKYARDQSIREIKADTTRNLTGKAVKANAEFFKKVGTVATKAVTPSREALLYAAGIMVVIMIPFLVIMGVASLLTSSGEGRNSYIPVSAEVEAYRPLIRCYTTQYGIPEYEDLIAAVMMQESGGQGSDPMQCSESGYNTRYPHAPNAISDPEYSIEVGVHTLADALNMAGAESPIDLDRISLALQGYNYGSGYISWALSNYGGYSELNAIEFSNMMAKRYGWSDYGDKAYVSHVLCYYSVGRSFMKVGNATMVAVAQSQIGNVGGAPTGAGGAWTIGWNGARSL